MFHRHKTILLSLILTSLLFSGCAKHVTVHPGAISAFDSQAYDALTIAQGALTQAKANLNSGLWPQSFAPAINKVGQSYNAALGAYQLYRAAASAGGDAGALQASLTAALANLANDLAAMFTQAGAAPPKGN